MYGKEQPVVIERINMDSVSLMPWGEWSIGGQVLEYFDPEEYFDALCSPQEEVFV
jgi:hypothetical protein